MISVRIKFTILYDNIKLFLSKVLIEQLKIIEKEHPDMLFLFNVLVIIYDLYTYVRNFYIEYKTIIRSINFIIFIFSFHSSNLDLLTFIFLLDNLCLLYVLYIRYINPEFKNSYPKMHKLLDYLCNILFLMNIFIFIHSIFMNTSPRPSSGDNGKPSGSGNGKPSDSGGSGGPGEPGGPEKPKNPRSDYKRPNKDSTEEEKLSISVENAKNKRKRDLAAMIVRNCETIDKLDINNSKERERMYKLLKSNHEKLEEQRGEKIGNFPTSSDFLTW